MADKIKADVRKPFFAYRLFFQDPLFDLDELDNVASKAAFLAFRPWNISLENVTFKEDAANLAEEATTFSFLNGKITFSITPGGCSIGVTDANWSDTELVANIVAAGTQAVLKAIGATVDKQLGSILMHLIPGTGTTLDITSKIVRFDAPNIVGAPVQTLGFAVHRDDLLWVVDKSAHFQNGLFVRLDRWFLASDSFEQIAIQLNDDESKLLDMLGLEVD
jgi:hypothetical protein